MVTALHSPPGDRQAEQALEESVAFVMSLEEWTGSFTVQAKGVSERLKRTRVRAKASGGRGAILSALDLRIRSNGSALGEPSRAHLGGARIEVGHTQRARVCGWF